MQNLAALINLKENNSEAFFVADKNPKTVNLNNFSALLKTKKIILQHFSALVRNQKEVILQHFAALIRT